MSKTAFPGIAVLTVLFLAAFAAPSIADDGPLPGKISIGAEEAVVIELAAACMPMDAPTESVAYM
ncbi:hypothetical protein SLNWT_3428 [Streptomyces albus]|uniref:Uncharacterized protein n=1 Tax=Streptomyces albus (strain ATCC 21838 / DSM 41398 / FERM P-419 / JCM 4703 / NBRC 107858) TaxID=1081613 RepID=A0A0B5EQC7_STRA4|nr:hypothetical protein SLNWT_3428 [Streptomyces albus]AOU78109.1 hypothetical protein SLNHY_3418 [Streptomyces albus]AYN33864.1 hypothetical protein DUI70_3363 [Streptomyces albus]